jgi:steroid delta-isomerase-like uncharacterized protein
MSLEANKAIVRRYFDELWNERKTDIIDDLVTADHVVHFPSGQAHRIKSVQEWTTTAFTAFPDVQFTVDDMIAEEDKVLARWHYNATQTGNFLGIPPTGRQVEDEGMDVFRIEGGKIAEIWVIQDSLGLLQQLGVIPRPQESGR